MWYADQIMTTTKEATRKILVDVPLSLLGKIKNIATVKSMTQNATIVEAMKRYAIEESKSKSKRERE